MSRPRTPTAVLELRGAFQKPPKTGQGQIGAGLRVLKLATEAPLSGKVGSHDESCHLRFRVDAADDRRGRASWLGQLRREQTADDQWSDPVLQVSKTRTPRSRCGPVTRSGR